MRYIPLVPQTSASGLDATASGTHLDGAKLHSVRSDLLSRVASLVDVENRSDLRRRLADGLERALAEEDTSTPLMLPSTRTLAGELRVHRKTATAALRLLVDRSIVRPSTGGRFIVVPRGAPVRRAAGTTDELAAEAAAAATREEMSEAQFVLLAKRSYRQAAMGGSRVVFVEPSERIPGIGPDDLVQLLDYPVSVRPLGDLRPSPDVVFVAIGQDAPAVRERFNGRADVFSVGLAFDTELRLATANLDDGARVAVVATDDAILTAIWRRITSWRPDLLLSPHHGPPDEVEAGTTLVLAPRGMALPKLDTPVAPYECAISPAELRFLQARLNPAASRPAHPRREGSGTPVRPGSARDAR
jgi:DNA-binding transcriptional regulator YhcF (GntR family)